MSGIHARARRVTRHSESWAKAFADTRSLLASCVQTLADAKKIVMGDISKWQMSHDDHEKLHESAEAGAKEHKQKLDLIKQLRVQEASLLKRATDLEKDVADLPHVILRYSQFPDQILNSLR